MITLWNQKSRNAGTSCTTNLINSDLVFWSLADVMKRAKLTKDNNRTPNDDAKMCEIGNGAQNIHNFVVIFAGRQDCNQLEDCGGTNNTPTQDKKCCCLKKKGQFILGGIQ